MTVVVNVEKRLDRALAVSWTDELIRHMGCHLPPTPAPDLGD
jgi:hypothetical protein